MKFFISEMKTRDRLDVYLSREIKYLTRTYIKKLIEKGGVTINKKLITLPSTIVRYNDIISINIIQSENKKIIPSQIKIEVIYEDDSIVIVNKPKGMIVHPGAGNTSNTLANALAYKFKNNLSDINGKLRPGIVHRIDKETSGILVIAKNNFAHSNLSKQFSEHTIKRKYKCLIWGVIRPLNGRIETLIARSKKNRQLMSVSEINGKKAVTNYRTIKVFDSKDIPKISLLECELETGRTHQIRVHLKYKGTSILGDKKYGKKNIKFRKKNKSFSELHSNINGQALHAGSLEFKHPVKEKWLKFKTNLPTDFKNMLNFLEKLDG